MTKKQNILFAIVIFCFSLFLAFNWSHFFNKEKDNAETIQNITYQDNLDNINIEGNNAQKYPCKNIEFNIPSKEELDYNELIKEDPFVKYLRFTLNKFSDGDYIPCEDGCSVPGLFFSSHFEDSAYSELEQYDKEMLKSKFIVLQTDIAVGGGSSIVILFKEYPDWLYYAWVYSDSDDYFDLRDFHEYNLLKNIEDIQKIFINQICNEDMGI